MITDRDLDILQIEVQDYMLQLLEEYEKTRQGNRRGEVGYGAQTGQIQSESGGRPAFDSQGLGDNISGIISG